MSIPRSAIVDLLTPGDKATVLMAAGLPPGRAADLASRGPADFWAALAQQGKERDERTWRDYPACWALVCGNAAVPVPGGKVNQPLSDSGSRGSQMTRPFLRDDVDELNLEQCLTDQEGQQIRYYLNKHAESPIERAAFASHDSLRTISQVLNKAIDRKMPLALVADAIDQKVGKKTIADKLRARMHIVALADDNPQSSATTTKKARVADEDKVAKKVLLHRQQNRRYDVCFSLPRPSTRTP
jgi:hypothetical protein